MKEKVVSGIKEGGWNTYEKERKDVDGKSGYQ